ncbi:endonuclease domain-containing protein [Paramicrobacterium chengjingii]|uniref:endonuclease domain-containing protein n=1 Tax=Paramicrobacterium chengjingii TaxID=2769067 RepID=UPI00141D8D1E|nr:DUF559 domain-containing protein [Microbacterium chengjingii]
MRPADVCDHVSREGGICHRLTLYEAGFTKNVIRAAVRTGLVRCAARNWLYTSACSVPEKWAAFAGGQLTCVTAARHLGLWVRADDARCHIAVHSSAGITLDRNKVRVHYGAVPVPRSTRTLIDPIVNVIVNASQCVAFESAVALADSAVRSGFVQRAELRRVQTRSSAFKRVAAAVSELSDSGIETIPRIRLAAHGIAMAQQVKIAGHRVDGLVGDRLVLQFDGAEHLSREQKQIDARHDAELQLLGYTVLRFTYWDVVDLWHEVEAQILRAIAQGLHLESAAA